MHQCPELVTTIAIPVTSDHRDFTRPVAFRLTEHHDSYLEEIVFPRAVPDILGLQELQRQRPNKVQQAINWTGAHAGYEGRVHHSLPLQHPPASPPSSTKSSTPHYRWKTLWSCRHDVDRAIDATQTYTCRHGSHLIMGLAILAVKRSGPPILFTDSSIPAVCEQDTRLVRRDSAAAEVPLSQPTSRRRFSKHRVRYIRQEVPTAPPVRLNLKSVKLNDYHWTGLTIPALSWTKLEAESDGTIASEIGVCISLVPCVTRLVRGYRHEPISSRLSSADARDTGRMNTSKKYHLSDITEIRLGNTGKCWSGFIAQTAHAELRGATQDSP
ncbi:hypothetical protein DFH29DRAFT_1069039 [Suillus ampliporus]|nr:hypothetical protein DFH29DRAFT_1069039 [Suillus ampliporus]